jgi:hypothetical protein
MYSPQRVDDEKPGTIAARWGGGMLALYPSLKAGSIANFQRFEKLCLVVNAPFAPLATSSIGGGDALTSS